MLYPLPLPSGGSERTKQGLSFLAAVIQFHFGAVGVLLKSSTDGPIDRFKHRTFVRKTNLGFGGVDVDVYLGKVNGKIEATHGIAFRGNIGGEGLLQRGHDGTAFDVSAVDEYILIATVSSGILGRADIATDANAPLLTFYGE